jgi:haloacetate dehalogenase
LVLWGERGVVHRLFDPLSLWRAQCVGEVSGYPLDCGHFIAEECPRETAQALREFLRGRSAR